MWQRFTERARKVVFYAQEEAGRRGHGYVSTEHLLLGLIRDGDNVACKILDRLGIALESIREEIEGQIPAQDGKAGADMQLTPHAKRVIDLAYDEARILNNNYIGTEHLLLGLIREGEGLAAKVLSKLGVELDKTRSEIRSVQEAHNPDSSTDPETRQRNANSSFNRQNQEVSAVLHRAAERSLRDHTAIGLEHILFAILEDPNRTAVKALATFGVTTEKLEQALRQVRSNTDGNNQST